MAVERPHTRGDAPALREYDAEALAFEEVYDAEAGCLLRLEAPDGHRWYGVEMNGVCRPSFDAGATSLYLDGDDRVTVALAIEDDGLDGVDEYAARYTIVEHVAPEFDHER